MNYFGMRRMEIVAEKRKPRPRAYRHRTQSEKAKPMPADTRQLQHIAARLRSMGLVNFADVIERAAKKLAEYDHG